ncbi:MAG: hypothetical protein R2715_02430 [Ilumatobacteraceae bacterium]
MAALLALAAAVGWGSSDYAAGVASRKSTAVSVVVLTHFASVLALLVVSIDARDVVSIAAGTGSSGRGVEIGLDLAGFRIAGSPSSLDLLWGAAAGLSGGMGALFLYRGLARGAMAVVAPITAAGAAAMPAVFGVATGESISPLGIAGLLLALVAIVMVSMSGGEAESVEAEAADTVGTVATVPVAVPVPRPFGTRRRRERQTLPHTVLPFLALCFVAAPYAGPRALNASAVSSPWFDGSALVLIGVVLGVFVLSTQLASATANGGAVAPRPGVAHRRHTVAAPARSKRGLAAPGVLDAIVSGAGFGCFYIVLARADEAAGNWPLVVARPVGGPVRPGGAVDQGPDPSGQGVPPRRGRGRGARRRCRRVVRRRDPFRAVVHLGRAQLHVPERDGVVGPGDHQGTNHSPPAPRAGGGGHRHRHAGRVLTGHRSRSVPDSGAIRPRSGVVVTVARSALV